jgi:hypothetical protein
MNYSRHGAHYHGSQVDRASLRLLIALIILGPGLYLGWPASAYLAVALIVYRASRNATNLWAKAANSVALPAVIGFGIVTAILYALNLIVTSPTQADVSHVEFLLVSLGTSLRRLNLAWWLLILVLIVLVGVNRLIPRASVVSRFMWAKKRLSRVTTALAIASSVAFVATDGVVSSATDGIRARISTQFKTSRDNQRRDATRSRGAEEAQDTLHRMSPLEFQYIRDVVVELEHTPLTPQARTDVLRHLVTGDTQGSALAEASDVESEAVLPDLDPEGALQVQRAREAAALKIADAEERKAFDEIARTLVGEGSGEVKAFVLAFVGVPVDGPSDALFDQARRYLGKVFDNYVDAVTKPAVDRYATAIEEQLRERLSALGTSERPGVRAVRQEVNARFERMAALAGHLYQARTSFSVALGNYDEVEKYSEELAVLRDGFIEPDVQLEKHGLRVSVDSELLKAHEAISRHEQEVRTVEEQRRMRESIEDRGFERDRLEELRDLRREVRPIE